MSVSTSISRVIKTEMKIEDWQKIDELLNRALDLESTRRAAFLDEIGAESPGLRREVESLLAAETDSENFLASPAIALSNDFFDQPPDAYAGKRIGQYKVVGELGRGGMGAVYLAERADGEFSQRVAVKIIRQTLTDPGLVRYFKRERDILASLNHPFIASLIDGGVSEDGMPFLAMEYVEGLSVTEFAKRKNLSVEQKLALFLKICQGVAYAHRNLIVHRDIKPSNIFVTADGMPKLLDFGLAKILEANVDSLQTETALQPLTPAYASPEQLRGEPISTASDIYSLGIVLYELLTTHRPFHFKSNKIEEIIKNVSESEPPRPSSVVSGHFSNGRAATDYDEPQTTKGQLYTNPKSKTQNPKSLVGDIDNIVLTALRKEPARRYQSVEQFAEDIERHLKGLPVKARPNTFAYRAEKFVTRNKIGLAAAVLVFLTLIGGIATTAWQARAARIERDAAERERVKAERVTAFLESMLGSPAASEKGRDVKVIDVLDESAARVESELADQPEVLASVEHTLGFSYGQIGNVDAAVQHTKTAMDLSAQVYGENSAKYAFVGNEYANVLYAKGDYADSEKFCRESIEIFRRIGAGESKEVANNLILLGLLLADKGQLEEAGQTYAESLDIFRKLDLMGTQDAIGVLNNLGHLSNQRGDYDQAERYYKEAVATGRKLPDSFSQTSLATTLQNLGAVYKQKGDYAAAEPLIREAIEMRRRLLGEHHPHVAIAQCHLSDLFYRQGEYEKAIQEAQSALEFQRAALPAGHADIARSLLALGQALTAKGESARAEPFLREALEIRRKALTNGSPLLSQTESALGECLAAQKKFQAAETLTVGSYAALEASQGAKSLNTLEALNRTIKLYENWNKPEEAERFRAKLSEARKDIR